MAKSDGWIKLSRSMLDNEIWTDSEPFDKRSAWIDLLLRTNYTEGHGKYVANIERGQVLVSIRSLARRWHWTEKEVRCFLGTLKGTDMVTLKGTPRGTLLTIVNYGKYQGSGHTQGHTEGHTLGHTEGQRYKNIEEEDKKRRSSNRPASLQEKIEAMKRFIAEDKENDQGRGTEAL